MFEATWRKRTRVGHPSVVDNADTGLDRLVGSREPGQWWRLGRFDVLPFQPSSRAEQRGVEGEERRAWERVPAATARTTYTVGSQLTTEWLRRAKGMACCYCLLQWSHSAVLCKGPPAAKRSLQSGYIRPACMPTDIHDRLHSRIVLSCSQAASGQQVKCSAAQRSVGRLPCPPPRAPGLL